MFDIIRTKMEKQLSLGKTRCTFFFISIFLYIAGASLLDPVIENVVHLQTALPPPETPGIWRKKMIWKARWVKEWKQSKNWRPVWKKVWSPIEIREWLPIPRPPPADVTASISFSGGDSHGPAVYPPHSPNPERPHNGPFPGPGSQEIPSSVYLPGTISNDGLSGPPHGPESQGRPTPTYSEPDDPPEALSTYNPSPSTQLHQVNDLSDWPSPDAQDLLSSYQTIKTPDNDVEFQKPQRPPSQNRPPPTYNAPRNPGILAQFLEPPRSPSVGIQASRLVSEFHYSEPIRNTTDSRPNSVSPYAAKLAQAVLREKFNQSLNPTERPSGLTDVIYKPDQSPTTPKPTAARVTKAAAQSTTENSSNVYIVTPVAIG